MIAPAKKLPVAVSRARRHLAQRGWTYRSAATACGVSYQHLSDVLNSHRISASLLAKISALPAREVASAK